MCLPSDQVEALHTITAELKAEHILRDAWLGRFDNPENPTDLGGYPPNVLSVTRAEAERIFADRIAAHEARLKELGWTRTVRVESAPATSGAAGGYAVSDIPRN